ncbi:CGNR zinc finger domain-containing protein [Homoserinimonas sp. A520]
MIQAGYAGGAPILGEGLALDLMNTYYATRGKPAEALGSPEHATAWVRQVADRLADAGAPSAIKVRILQDDLDALLELRNAVRGIAARVVAGDDPDQNDVDCANRLAALSPRWTSMTWGPGAGAKKTTQTAGVPLDQVLSALAADAIELFSGSDAVRLRMCERPGCDLFFLKDHPRREWCTPACGARVRAARSYAKRVSSQRAHSA